MIVHFPCSSRVSSAGIALIICVSLKGKDDMSLIFLSSDVGFLFDATAASNLAMYSAMVPMVIFRVHST